VLGREGSGGPSFKRNRPDALRDALPCPRTCSGYRPRCGPAPADDGVLDEVVDGGPGGDLAQIDDGVDLVSRVETIGSVGFS
jgi:hypothetical protein